MDKEIIIIGAGPSGISLAVEAVRRGVPSSKILILEKGKAHSWSIRKLYPDKKLVTANFKGQAAICNGVMCLSTGSKGDTLSYLDKYIDEFNLDVRYGENVNSISKILESGVDGFKVETSSTHTSKICIIAIGIMGRPNRPNFVIKPELRKFVSYDINTKKINSPKVLVVGGGDSAAEFAQYLSLENYDVTLSYRRSSFSRLNEINLKSIKELVRKGLVKTYLNSDIDSITPTDKGGVVNFINGNVEEFNHFVFAIGGTTPHNFLKVIGIDFDEAGPILKDGHETTIKGLFLIGDLSAGKRGGSIISAFNSSHNAIKKICKEYLDCCEDSVAY